MLRAISAWGAKKVVLEIVREVGVSGGEQRDEV
jgi:hypothetical protein